MAMTTGRIWPATIHVATGFAAGLAGFTAVLTVGVVALPLCCTIVGAPYGLAALFATGDACSGWQRSRFAAVLGTELTPTPPVLMPPSGAPGGARLRQALGRARSPGIWRQLTYHLLAGPLGSAGFAFVACCWSVALGAIVTISFGWSLPESSLFGLDVYHPVLATTLPLLAVVLAVVAVVSAKIISALDTAAARALLQPSRSELLARRVEVLAESRADVVDAADAERRRIERDLHDGAQQRLVSLAMNLGIARATLTELDPRAELALRQAHDEAKLALTELRELVRGLHPAVLDDRGLDAALSGIAARAPLPVHLTVQVPNRPSRTIEAVAYFVVSEALANVAKHAAARQVQIAVTRVGSRLRMTVRDDGRGGADPAGGTGLRGLAQRVGSVDGTLQVDSPVGGPTLITVELPCES